MMPKTRRNLLSMRAINKIKALVACLVIVALLIETPLSLYANAVQASFDVAGQTESIQAEQPVGEANEPVRQVEAPTEMEVQAPTPAEIAAANAINVALANLQAEQAALASRQTSLEVLEAGLASRLAAVDAQIAAAQSAAQVQPVAASGNPAELEEAIEILTDSVTTYGQNMLQLFNQQFALGQEVSTSRQAGEDTAALEAQLRAIPGQIAEYTANLEAAEAELAAATAALELATAAQAEVETQQADIASQEAELEALLASREATAAEHAVIAAELATVTEELEAIEIEKAELNEQAANISIQTAELYEEVYEEPAVAAIEALTVGIMPLSIHTPPGVGAATHIVNTEDGLRSAITATTNPTIIRLTGDFNVTGAVMTMGGVAGRVVHIYSDRAEPFTVTRTAGTARHIMSRGVTHIYNVHFTSVLPATGNRGGLAVNRGTLTMHPGSI
ncbi:MAG: hypothetical protein FWC78_05380, partial [Defluviitaleaceae bacterium]|nr:hypothetical protein [Defluviitaleaceae bacterium]